MFADPFQIIFLLALLAFLFGIYGPALRRSRQQRLAFMRGRGVDIILDVLVLVGWQLIPAAYIFTPWLDFADYHLPDWVGWSGVAILLLALLVIWRGYADLGPNWTPRMEGHEERALVTDGIYRFIRYPIYSGLWLWAVAQPLLLHNWIAGWALLVVFLPFYLLRLPYEEKRMEDRFGVAYRLYMRRTGQILPRLSGWLSEA